MPAFPLVKRKNSTFRSKNATPFSLHQVFLFLGRLCACDKLHLADPKTRLGQGAHPHWAQRTPGTVLRSIRPESEIKPGRIDTHSAPGIKISERVAPSLLRCKHRLGNKVSSPNSAHPVPNRAYRSSRHSRARWQGKDLFLFKFCQF